MLANVSPILDDQALYERLKASSDLGKFKASIGSTDAPSDDYLIPNDDSDAMSDSDEESGTDEESDTNEDAQSIDKLFELSLINN